MNRHTVLALVCGIAVAMAGCTSAPGGDRSDGATPTDLAVADQFVDATVEDGAVDAGRMSDDQFVPRLELSCGEFPIKFYWPWNPPRSVSEVDLRYFWPECESLGALFESVDARDAAEAAHPDWFENCGTARGSGRPDVPYCIVMRTIIRPENAESLCEIRAALDNVEWVCKLLELT